MMSRALVIAGILGAVGVAIGAYSAHGLEDFLKQRGLEGDAIAKRLAQCDTAVRYHLIHTLALLAIGLSGVRGKAVASTITFWFAGIILFCGGLYSLVFLGELGHWAIVPSGGLCFIIGWILVILVGLNWHSRKYDSVSVNRH